MADANGGAFERANVQFRLLRIYLWNSGLLMFRIQTMWGGTGNGIE